MMNSTDLESLEPTYLFQWVVSPVLLPFGPELLEIRGLAFITPTIPTAYIVLQPICKQDAVSSSDKRIEKLLTRLTSKVSV